MVQYGCNNGAKPPVKTAVRVCRESCAAILPNNPSTMAACPIKRPACRESSVFLPISCCGGCSGTGERAAAPVNSASAASRNPGHRITPFNSNFIVSDPNESFTFESHQRKWVAKKVDRYAYIGNCYSIQEDYDMIADGAIEEACEKGWWHPEVPFNPAKAWTVDELMYDESEGFVRWARVGRLISDKVNSGHKMDIRDAMSILRDHYDGVPELQSIFSKAANKTCSICTHPGGVGYGCASAASTVTVLRKDVPDELRFTYWGSMAPPCCSIFRPYYNIGFLPDDLQHAHALYRPQDQWWQFIELERYIALNYEKFAPKVKEEFHKMEEEFIQQAEYVESSYNGDISKLRDFSAEATKRSSDKAIELTNEIKSKLVTKDIDRMLLKYFTEASDECGMDYDKSIIK